MLDILACPIDKYYPLELIEIDTAEDKIINENLILIEKPLTDPDLMSLNNVVH